MATQAKTKKTNAAETFMGSFDPKDFDMMKISESVREFAEDGFNKQSEAYSKFQATAEDATKVAEQTFEAVKNAHSELTSKLVANSKSNMEASAAFAEKLWGIGSLSEAIDIQSTFFRSQFDTLTAQSKEIQEASVAASEKALAPSKNYFEKAVA